MWDDQPQNSISNATLSQKTSSLCESWGQTLGTRLQRNCFRRVL